ncbi:hemagglutinin repeat-containing protein [Stenotrophomonas maltophilia]|uniref:hemagglutinin repeat-containing protein n=2 Tax=Stenotrophomonas maltophilia TaxID=40324 RepID=UPI002449A4E5|nr:hemagglutinin repeat-containing protein [Stenotrophomonas maltophilia]MDH1117375.1 hemagglutinin repeat-containing protein [Stenotrophomonas maltophilia]MDH1201485.1 hemagglutinin repeat-containing protein [Stenotrophomonas maltophilia]
MKNVFRSLSLSASGAGWATRLRTAMASATLALAFLAPGSSFAQVQVQAGEQARADQAANGVPVIQINRPNAGGVSHNRFQDYNVGREGQILNNSASTVQTQLGGYIQGNGNLQLGQSARLILNEVTSTNASRLQGHIEVAGRSAAVIVANPNGITCDGCGFINTTRGTLTTGTPVFGNDGSLSAFRVSRGTIRLEGNGLDAGNLEGVDLLARAVQLNAGLWARQVNVVTGANQIDAQTLATQAITGEGERPQFGLDVAALGGMYAGKIRLVGTEAGVGVRSTGQMVADAGDFILTQAGDVRLSGRTAAAGRLQIETGGDLKADGTQYAQGDLQIRARQASLAGSTSAGAALAVRANQNLDLAGSAQAAQMQLDAGGMLTLADTVKSAGSIALAAAQVQNHAQVTAGAGLAVRADTLAQDKGARLGAQALDVQVRQVDNAGLLLGNQGVRMQAAQLHNAGQLYSDADVELDAASIDNEGIIGAGANLRAAGDRITQLKDAELSAGVLLKIQARQQLDNAGRILSEQALELSAGGVDNQGTLEARQATLTVDRLRNSGTLQAVDLLALKSNARIDNDTTGSIQGGKGLQVDADVLDNAGIIGSAADARLSVATLDNRNRLEAGGTLTLQGGVLHQQAAATALARVLAVDVQKVINDGRLHGQQAMDLRTTELSNSGVIYGRDRSQLRTTTLDNAGVIASDGALDVRTDALHNRAGGNLSSAQSLQLDAVTLDNAGNVFAKGALTAKADVIDNRGDLYGAGDVDVTVRDSLDNQGSLVAGQTLQVRGRTLRSEGELGSERGNVQLSSDQALVLGGRTLAAGTLTAHAGGSLEQSGKVFAQQGVVLSADAGVTLKGTIDSAADLQVRSDGDLHNEAALFASGALSLQAAQALRTAADVQARTVTLQAAQASNRGRVLASGDIELRAGQIDNSGVIVAGLLADGKVGSTGSVTLDARQQLRNGGQINAGHQIHLLGDSLLLEGGQVWSGGTLLAQARSGEWRNIGGSLAAIGLLDLRATDLLRNGGSLQGTRIGLLAAALDNSAGELLQTGTDPFELGLTGALRNTGGRIAANAGSVHLKAAQLLNQGGRIEHAGTGVLKIETGTLDNSNAGLIVGNGEADVAVAGRLDNSGGTLTAGSGARVTGTEIVNTGGRLDAGGNLTVDAAGALDNRTGTIVQRGSGQLQVLASQLDNSNGLLGAEGNARVTSRTGDLRNVDGNLYARQQLALDVAGALANQRGLVHGGTSLDLQIRQALDNSQGNIEAQGAANIRAASVGNRGGRIVANGTGQLSLESAAALDNRGGTLGSTGGALTLTAGSVDNRAEGGQAKLVAGTDLRLQTASLDNAGSMVHAANTLYLERAGAQVFNVGGQLSAGNLLRLDLAALDNSNGRLLSRQSQLTLGSLANGGGEISAYEALGARLQAFSGIGRLFGGSELRLTLAGDYVHGNGQRLESNGLLKLDVAGALVNQGRLESKGTLEVSAARIENTAGGQFNATAGNGSGRVALSTAGDFSNAGRVDGDTVEVSAANITNTGTVMGNALELRASRITNGRDLGNTLVARDYNEGLMAATGRINLYANYIDNLDGELFSLGDIRLQGWNGGNAQQIRNRSGRIQAENDLILAALGVANERRVLVTQHKVYSGNEGAADPDSGTFRVDGIDGPAPPGKLCPGDCAVLEVWTEHKDLVLEGTTVIAASAASQLISGRDMQMSGGSVDNRNSAIAAGRNLSINGRGSSNSEDPNDWAGVVNNEALAGYKVVQRTSTIDYTYRPCPSRCDFEIYGGSRALGTSTVTKQVTLAGGNASITAGRKVQIEAREVNNAVVTAHSGGTPLDVAGWQGNNAYAPELGQQQGAGAVGGNAGAPGAQQGVATGPASAQAQGAGTAGDTGSPGPGRVTTVPPPQVVGSPQNPLPGLSLPSGGLYTVNPGNQRWLVETDPRFANFGQWIGSDYMFQRLNLDPDKQLRRMGDDFYEQRLVMEQITGLTGRRYLDADQGDGMGQYRAMMDAGVTEAARQQLSVGVALSAEQVAALNEDIVWMVAQEVDGQKVLVPVVYLSQATANRLQLGGAAIAGESVEIRAGNVSNQGMIRADDRLTIDTGSLLNDRGGISAGGNARITAVEDILNNSGLIQGGNVALVAGRDLKSVSGIDVASIRSGGSLALEAGRDLALVGSQTRARGNAALEAGRDLNLTTQMQGDGSLRRTTLDVGGSLSLDAGHDLNLTAVTAKAGGSVHATAGNDINLNALTTTEQGGWGSNRYTRETLNASGIEAGGSLGMQAGQDVNLQAAQLKAGDGLAVVAGRDLNLQAETTTNTSQQQSRGKRFSQTTQSMDETVHGTSLQAGGDIALVAGRDANLTATQVGSTDGGISIAATRDVNLLAAQEDHSWEQETTRRKKGLLSSKTTTTYDATRDSLVVGTTLSGETVTIGAGRDVVAQAAQVAATGDVVVAATRDLTIGTATSTHSEEHDKTVKRSGVFGGGGFNLTIGQSKLEKGLEIEQSAPQGSLIGSTDGRVNLSAGNTLHITGSDVLSKTGTQLVGGQVVIDAAQGTTDVHQSTKQKSAGINVGLTGGVVDAALAAYGAAKAAGNAQDDRLKALYAVQAANAAAGVGGAMQQGASGATDGVSLRIGIGASSSSASQTSHDQSAVGSTIRSQGDVSIVATAGDLSIIGSRVKGDNVALAARDNITLRSETEDHTQSSKNKSGSGEIGFSIGAQTGWYVSASTAKGKGSGNGTTHVETVVDADRNLTVISGKDTTLQGAQLSGDKVVASIGGNLSIISEQDTDDYASKQTQAGGTFVYGSGGTVNIGQQKVESHLRSVQEQSGIVAGSGGFNITVGGNTHLEGGVIGSTADASKNRLDTGSLTVVDIENESRAKTSGGGIGTGMSSGGGISNPLGSAAGAGLSLLGGTKKNDSSTTRSDIAAGTVVVRDGNESALAGLDRTATGFDTDSALSAVDLRKMQERAEVMQLGGQLLFKGVGDLGGYLSQKAETEEGKAFWADGGNGRALLHGMAGAAMAALGGADALNGAVSAAGAEKAKIAISEFLESNKGNLSWEDYQSLMEVGSAMVGGALGGSTGANIAVTGDRFNRQLHPDEVKWIRFHAEEFAREQKISKEEAYRILLVEAAAYVDSKIQSDLSGVENNTDAIDFLRKNQNKYDWGTAFDSSDRDNFSKFSEELGRETGYFKDVYTAISGTAYAAGSTKDWRFEFQEPLRYYGDASRSQKGVAMVQAGAAALGIGAAAAVEFGGWCILNPYSCGRAASGAIDAVMGDYVGGHSLAPVLPALVAAKAATTAEQTLRLSSGAVGAEIAGNAAKKGGLQSEQVLKPMQAAGADVAEAGAKAGASEQSSLANLNRLSPQEEAELLKRQLIQAERHDPWIGTTLPGAEAPVTVTAEATVGGRMLKDTNQTARPTKLADADHPTLVADLLPPGAPNSSMKSAHAEIAVIQRAYEQGLTNAQKMLIVVRGEGVCSYCQRSDNLIAAAQRSGLSKLEIIDVERNTKMVWNRGEKSFFEVTLHE